mgnify:CR=1 FL=1
MNNAVFGKTMENDEKNAVKWFSKINFKTSKSIDNLHLIEMIKQKIVYDKPIYVGTSILDLSKLTMMDFHYNVIHKEFEGKYNLLYSDTDSCVYNIEHPDIYKWVSDNREHFDLSDSLNKDLKDNANKKVLGKMKDELQSVPMKEFIALNPKLYSFMSVKKEIKHENYKNVLETGKSITKEVTGIRSLSHELYTVKQVKTALNTFYDKMYMTDNNTCLPYGYKNL